MTRKKMFVFVCMSFAVLERYFLGLSPKGEGASVCLLPPCAAIFLIMGVKVNR